MTKKKHASTSSSFSSSSSSDVSKLTPEQEAFKRESLEFFKRPDLLSLIKMELDRDHIGDDREKLFLFICELSSQLPPQYRFSTAIVGYSSEGKTHAWRTTSKHLPRSWYLDLTRATAAVIEDDIKPFNLLYVGEEGANEAILETVKQLSEDGICAMKKDLRNDCKSVRKEEQPRKVLIYSTTHDARDEELSTRYATISITGDSSKYHQVNMHNLDVASNISKEIDETVRDTGVTWIRAGLEQLQPVDYITIPYASFIEVDDHRARSMRDLKRFLSVIRTLAWLHQLNRVTIEYNGRRVLYASPADYWNAREISDAILTQSLSGVEQRLQRVIDVYQDIVHGKSTAKVFEPMRDGRPDPKFDQSLKWVDRSDLQNTLRIASRDTIKSHVKALESMGVFTCVWTGNRIYVAMKDASPINSPTKHPLITHEREAEYRKIKADYDMKISGSLVGSSSLDSSVAPPVDSSLLKISEKLQEGNSPTKRPAEGTQKHEKQVKKPEISGSELVARRKYTTPDDVRQFILREGDNDGTIGYNRLRERFDDKYITGMIEAQLLKVQLNGNYKMMEVCSNDEEV